LLREWTGPHGKETPDTKETPSWLWMGLSAVPVAALFAIFVYAVADWDMLAVAALVAGGALLAGGLLGFLFGIPRSLTREEPDDATAGSSSIRPNTNLEQISDWLTKILVGVGLVQFTTLARHAGDLVNFLGPAFGSGVLGETFAGATLVVFGVSGFLLFYLVTRIYLPRSFAAANQLVELAVETSVAQFHLSDRAQEEADVRARAMVTRQLNPEPGAPTITQDELNEVVSAASLNARATMFGQARNQRQSKAKTDKPAMERTIPVFRALIAAETDQKFHRNRGQLGYALKDQEKPDFPTAVAMLTEAIEVRDESGDGGFLLYEFNRALAQIRQFGPNPPPEMRAKIEADLKACTKSSFLKKAIKEDEEGIIKPFLEAAHRTS
jgi:hypothetical protein